MAAAAGCLQTALRVDLHRSLIALRLCIRAAATLFSCASASAPSLASVCVLALLLSVSERRGWLTERWPGGGSG